MGEIAYNIEQIRKELPSGVKLIAVSKTQPNSSIEEAYAAGQRAFGENRAMELAEKLKQLPADIEWHYIGHLQTNKVKFIIPAVHLIHSVDSLRLLREISKEAGKAGRIVDCLLQFYIAREESKFGLDPDEARILLNHYQTGETPHVRICGVMGMASFVDDMEAVRQEFRVLRQYFQVLKNEFFAEDAAFSECSMGMSHDYHVAVEEGSTMLRIGTAVFGDRKGGKP